MNRCRCLLIPAVVIELFPNDKLLFLLDGQEMVRLDQLGHQGQHCVTKLDVKKYIKTRYVCRAAKIEWVTHNRDFS